MRQRLQRPRPRALAHNIPLPGPSPVRTARFSGPSQCHANGNVSESALSREGSTTATQAHARLMGRSVPGLVGPAGLVGTGEMGRTVQALPADASTCVYARGRCVHVPSLPPVLCLIRPHGTVPCVCIFPTQYPDRCTTRWSHHLKHVCLANGGLRNHVLQELKAKAGACLNLRDG